MEATIWYPDTEGPAIFALTNNGVGLDFNLLPEVIVEFRIDNLLVDKWTKTVQAGFDRVEAFAGFSNKCQVFTKKEHRANYPSGQLICRLIVAITDANYPEGRRESIDFKLQIIRNRAT